MGQWLLAVTVVASIAHSVSDLACAWRDKHHLIDDQASVGPSPAGTGIDGFFRINIVPGMRMRVLGDETSFREACSHFPNDELNGVSPAKLERLGQEAVIVNTFIDNTVTCRFDDGAQYDMPATALALLNETGGHSPQQSTHLHARVVPSEYCAHFDARQEVCTPKLSSLATTVRFSQ